MTYTPATVTQVVQWAFESEAGVAVEPVNRFRSTNLTLSPKYETEVVRPSGSRYGSTTYLKKVSTEIKIEDSLIDWNELPTLLEWAFGGPMVVDGVCSYTIGRGRTMTLAQGDLSNGEAAQVTNCFVSEFGFKWGKNSGDATVTGSVMGSFWDEHATIPNAAPSREVLPMDATQVNVYVDDTKAGMGKTQLKDAISVEFTTGSMRNSVWTLDRAFVSYSDRVDQAITDGEVTLLVKATGEGKQFVTALRNGQTKYLRIEAKNAAGDRFFHADLAVKSGDISYEDSDDVWAMTVTLKIIEDGSGFSHQFQISAPDPIAAVEAK
jgi:hypothetical protein